MKVLVTPTSFSKNMDSVAGKKLKSFAREVIINPYGRPLQQDEAVELLKGVDGYIAGLDYISAEVIDSADSLKAISRYGVGYDRVDTLAAKKRGIIVSNTPGANTQAVADLAFALMLGVARRISKLDFEAKNGGWPRIQGVELYGKTIGILGFGAIGRAVAKRAAGFDMEVLAYDPFLTKEQIAQHNAAKAELKEIFERCHFISLHMPMNEDTKHMINDGAIALMQKDTIIINTARGGLIDEAAAYEALKAGRIGGMGLDAFMQEPPLGNPLLTLDNVIATPHTGAATKEAGETMALMAVQNLIDALTTGDCKNRIV